MKPLKLPDDFDVFQKQYAELLDQALREICLEFHSSRLMDMMLIYKQYAERAHQELDMLHEQMHQVIQSVNVYKKHQKRAIREVHAPHKEAANQSYDDYVACFF